MAQYNITAIEASCTGCLRCQLACSFLYTGRFNPSAAYIRVRFQGTACFIDFTDDCKHCGVCADNCFYDALQKVKKEAAE